MKAHDIEGDSRDTEGTLMMGTRARRMWCSFCIAYVLRRILVRRARWKFTSSFSPSSRAAQAQVLYQYQALRQHDVGAVASCRMTKRIPLASLSTAEQCSLFTVMQHAKHQPQALPM